MTTRSIAFVFTVLACVAFITGDALARGGRGGGGGFRGGGGGGYRGGGGYSRPASPAIGHSPSMSRVASPSASRPVSSMPSGSRPGGSRPSGPIASGRPTGGQRVGAGVQPGQGGVSRPAGGLAQGGRPSQAQLQQFLNLPSQGAGGRVAAGAGLAAAAGRPAGANSAVADFLQGGGTQSRNAGSLASQRADNISERTGARSDFRDSRGENRDFASDNRQGRVENRGDRQSGRVENRGEFRSSLADGRADRRTQRQQQLGEHADHIRDELNDHYDHDHLFDDFWANHPHAHYHFHQNPVFWTWATFNTVQAFMPWNWGTGAYYDYGTGGNVYYEDGTVYANGTAVPAEKYAQQAEEIATSVPEVEEPDQMEWLPLGVFALTQDDNPDAVPNMFLQLALSKEGIIAGTYQNKSTGQTESVEGMVDQKSQRAAWTVVEKNTPIIETGIANLTENETRVLVHFADGQTQQWLMVHMENPDAASQ